MTTTSEAPRRFTVDQVLAVFTTAGTSAAPMTTSEIAEACRMAAGIGRYRRDVSGTADVSKTLAALVADGRLVTSRAATYGKGWVGTDEQYRHLIVRQAGVERFYATPEQSAAWQSKLDVVAHEDQRAAYLAAAVVRAFESTPHPLTDDQARPSTRFAASPKVALSLTIEQAAYVVDRLDLTSNPVRDAVAFHLHEQGCTPGACSGPGSPEEYAAADGLIASIERALSLAAGRRAGA